VFENRVLRRIFGPKRKDSRRLARIASKRKDSRRLVRIAHRGTS
jgi:hypothetical protein